MEAALVLVYVLMYNYLYNLYDILVQIMIALTCNGNYLSMSFYVISNHSTWKSNCTGYG